MSSNALPPLPEYTTGHCACKRTQYRVQLTNLQEDLRLTAYCHCTSCQRLNGAPFVWTTHWAEEAVQWSSAALDGGSEKMPGSSSSSTAPTLTRTKGGARLIPTVSSSSSTSASTSSSSSAPMLPEATFAPTMAVYETLPGRKWKQRCDYCGTPLGSWNQAKRQWSLWPSTFSRDYLPPPTPTPNPTSTPSTGSSSSSSTTSPPPKEGLPHPTIQQAIRPLHHQFYGWWRTMDIPDKLPKWEGYAGASERVEE
ncbi:hypothetical protein BCV69DRAFT_96777 [Microstroma glucosiphilum]|uniref:CENP-V/GFA domain-containing protein n=1 Tax=Pseudomicrostroma glucosiphilum TaxID=1684307 RepID=A0A316UC57_9BASI|nr:hypothetical protein BCV69DRAFT_96777 [Pseudomicrostroma glucosiphilum]PWN22776.1 hypothetical protein BCV69DRAFT_96777 [Pseudomicrostroma glucosiphilum]